MRVESHISRLRAWAGLVVAPVAWAAHHLIGGDLNFADCQAGNGLTLLLIGVAALAIVALGAVLSFGTSRATRPQTTRFIAALSLMASALFALTILVQIVAALTLPPCFR
jgi:hypothetical protein